MMDGWPYWALVGAGIATLLVGGGLFALVGWATLRARELDDPAHPYLSLPGGTHDHDRPDPAGADRPTQPHVRALWNDQPPPRRRRRAILRALSPLLRRHRLLGPAAASGTLLASSIDDPLLAFGTVLLAVGLAVLVSSITALILTIFNDDGGK